MGLLKTALIAGGVLLGVGAIGGITAAVVTRQNSSALTANPNDTSDNAPSSMTQMQNIITAESILKSIKPSDIVVKDEMQEKAVSGYYAFDLGQKQLAVSSTTKIPEGYTTTVTIKPNNSVAELNNGKLTVTVKVENTTKQDTKSHDLELSDFKKIDASLIELFDMKMGEDSMMQLDPSYSLTLMPKQDMASKFISIEALNQKTPVVEQRMMQQQTNGLTTWLANSDKASKISGVKIEGEVKLKTISKTTDGPTVFELVSKKEDSYLTLVKSSENGQELKALVGSIKTTNLLASKIKVVPRSNDKDVSEIFEQELLKRAKMNPNNTGFKVDNKKLYVPVPENKQPEGTMSVDVELSSYVVKSNATDDNKIEIPLSLEVSFGTGSEVVSFNTTDQKHAKILQDAGFSFNFYTRLLNNKDDKKASDLVSSDITVGEQHHLEKYLTQMMFTTPSKQPTIKTMKNENAVANNGFYVIGPFKENLMNNQKWETIEWTSANTRNYIVFADYSYISAKGTNSMSSLNEKVLFTPNLSFINVQKQTQMP